MGTLSRPEHQESNIQTDRKSQHEASQSIQHGTDASENRPEPTFRKEVDLPWIRLPDKPARSIIEEQETPEGFVLSWKPRKWHSFGHYFVIGFLCFWLMGWAIGELSVLSILVHGAFAVLEDVRVIGGAVCLGSFMLFWLVGWTIGGFVAVRQLWHLVRPWKPERVILTEHTMCYEPGDRLFFGGGWPEQEKREVNSILDLWKQGILPKDKPSWVEWANSRPFAMDRDDNRQRLRFYSSGRWIELGKILKESEREWLYAVLEAWRARRTKRGSQKQPSTDIVDKNSK